MPINARRRVLITGHHGYIGSVLAPYLRSVGYDVVGLDTDYFRDCLLVAPPPEVTSHFKDLRDVTTEELKGFDAVVHLAALSNDSVGDLDPRLTRDINLEGSIQLAEKARAAGVRRFIFSSCIRRRLPDAQVEKSTRPAQQTEYATSKLAAEFGIGDLAQSSFSPTFLRNAAIYGVSPRMRFDTVLNDLMGAAITEGRIVIDGDRTSWRPVVHVHDLAAAFRAVLEAPEEHVHNQTFNIGHHRVNAQMNDLVGAVVAQAPRCRVEVANTPRSDSRSSVADFTKFTAAFPYVQFRAPGDGVRDLFLGLSRAGLTQGQFRDRRFTRLQWLQRLVHDARLDKRSLRWVNKPAGEIAR